ncbi:regulator of RNase E activity RraA [Spinactinospora alkalitolerans]|uniref:Putative 4-hydroxy-4-methyl-2-oxoglutarate aldolase n=1 Tax=Spinactinospora alkalitolerans TaxID=687207 RepID=A0A852U5C7_9ACTN|nr:RraA family protein [Spinactinospora alkalitolerans]NYE50093.1 regulator of RNase E activity RraA [Spinactinospora alkalitolerans]
MSIIINKDLPELPKELVDVISAIEPPTFGHFLEEGFCDPAISRRTGTGVLVGRAFTVRTTATDSTLVHKATSLLSPGDVLIVDTGGDVRHAPVGGVVGHAVAVSGALGVVVDGVCTDLAALHSSGLSVYSRGTSVLTTKLHGINAGGINVPVVCGDVVVRPGDVVIGDENGLIIADPAAVQSALPAARASDDNEPELLRRIDNGEALPQLSKADALLAELSVSS